MCSRKFSRKVNGNHQKCSCNFLCLNNSCRNFKLVFRNLCFFCLCILLCACTFLNSVYFRFQILNVTKFFLHIQGVALEKEFKTTQFTTLLPLVSEICSNIWIFLALCLNKFVKSRKEFFNKSLLKYVFKVSKLLLCIIAELDENIWNLYHSFEKCEKLGS